MKRTHAVIRSGWMVSASVAALFAIAAAAHAQSDPATLAADRSFLQALGRSDRSAVAGLLDANFTWTDVTGKSQTAAEIARTLPKPAISDEAAAQVQHYAYGPVGVVQGRAEPLDGVKCHVHVTAADESHRRACSRGPRSLQRAVPRSDGR